MDVADCEWRLLEKTLLSTAKQRALFDRPLARVQTLRGLLAELQGHALGVDPCPLFAVCRREFRGELL